MSPRDGEVDEGRELNYNEGLASIEGMGNVLKVMIPLALIGAGLLFTYCGRNGSKRENNLPENTRMQDNMTNGRSSGYSLENK